MPNTTGRFAPGAHASPTEIKPGQRLSPATEIKAGQRLSPATEFRPNGQAHNKAPLGTVRIRREAYTGHLRAWVKTAEPNIWQRRATVVWEKLHGPLPAGHLVHHKNGNSLDDDPRNLVALTRSAHVQAHRDELNTAKRNARAKPGNSNHKRARIPR